MLQRTHLVTRHLRPSSRQFLVAKMSTFTLPESGVPVDLIEGLSKEQLLEFPAFKVRATPIPYFL